SAVRRASRPLFVGVGVAFIVLLATYWFIITAPGDPDAPHFVPGQPAGIPPYNHVGFDWGNDVPIRDGKFWIWTANSATNFHEYLYDLNRGMARGELLKGSAVLANYDHSKLLVSGYASHAATFREHVLAFLAKRGLVSAKALSSIRHETFWLLDLRSNAARQVGSLSQYSGAGSRWCPSPTCRYAYNRPSVAKSGGEIYLVNLETGEFWHVEIAGEVQGWWDSSELLVLTPEHNLTLYDVKDGATETLFGAEALTAFLQKSELETNLDHFACIPNWNGGAYDFYFHARTNWVAGTSYLIKADRGNRSLKLLSKSFDYRWGGRFDAPGEHYVYDGEAGAPGSGGDGAVYLRDMADNSARTIVPPDNRKQYALGRLYRNTLVYFGNGKLWRIDLGSTNSVQILPPTGNSE